LNAECFTCQHIGNTCDDGRRGVAGQRVDSRHRGCAVVEAKFKVETAA
jgi:hypothetical protein